jgi:probable F420-dependent oxidoreductase
MVTFSYGFPLLSPPYGPERTEGASVTVLARAAERAGFAACYVTDHPAPPQRWREAGGHDAFDPFVALAFAAAATTDLRLFTNLTVVPYRSPFLLAKSVASLDRLSGGRVTLGTGTGYLRREFDALGVPFDDRNDRFDEFLDLCRAIWSGRPVDHQSGRVVADAIAAHPTPVQDPLPIWIGGNSALTRRRIASHAQGWIPLPNARRSAGYLRTPALETPEDLAALRSDLLERWTAAGREGAPVVAFTVPVEAPAAAPEFSAERHLDGLARWIAAGVTHVVHNGVGATTSEAEDHLASYAEQVVAVL